MKIMDNEYRKHQKGISLITLVITIIVVIILAAIIITSLTKNNLTDKATKARFMSDFRTVQEAVTLYSSSNIDYSSPATLKLPVDSKLTLADKSEITKNNATLKEKIEELNPGKTINDVNLYWIDKDQIGIKLSKVKQAKGYIIDVDTQQIYDYVGDTFDGLKWHTLDGGVAINNNQSTDDNAENEIWNGWIHLTLYYPANSTDRQWRLGSQGEIRQDSMLVWQDYTGSIWIPLDRMKDVWIKYKIDNKEVIIPPAGTLLVDISSDSANKDNVDKVNITITYDETAEIKEYKIGSSGWMEYTGTFSVTQNCLIQARAYKTDNVYNQDGSLLTTRKISGSDALYVNNIKAKDKNELLPSPTITRKDARNSDEIASVHIDYPDGANKKIYKINYGDEQEYSDDVSITKYGTYLIAYYYDASGKCSAITGIYINDTTKGESPKAPEEQKDEQPEDDSLAAPTITRKDAINSNEVAEVHVDYPEIAVKKVYEIDSSNPIEYNNDISISKYGEYVTAYYYDLNGKKSRSSTIYINDISEGQKPQEPSEDEPPTNKPKADVIPAPTINVDPTTMSESVQVSIQSPANADKDYIKIGRYSAYQEYKMPITVRENTEVYAYYTTLNGEKSEEGHILINNIIQKDVEGNTKPYLQILADPYPWAGSYGVNKVTVALKYSNADTVEYSEDGIIYKPYKSSFELTQNEMIYARATNQYGTTEAKLNITNISKKGEGTITPPNVPDNIAISINANPDPSLSTAKVTKVNIAIEYGSNAKEKYYTIGKYGKLKTYTGAFDVTSNCTIYAYAKGDNAQGSTNKKIDNISTGISEPEIVAVPANGTQSSKVNITINYDKSATIKRYSINGGTLSDYVNPFDVEENNTIIYAYSENALGQKSEAKYTVENIIPNPPVLLLDKGDYYLLKLNYPETSQSREYKWKQDGEWKTYNESGILLIKPEHKDDVIKNGTVVKIEDENGKKITFTGDYYLIDVPISEISENIFMRWDRKAASAPKIIPSTTDATRTLTATIIYDNSLIKKQYRILKPDGTLGEWQDYTGPISIDQNNTVIYAKGQDEAEVWSSEGSYKVTNIDEMPPALKLTADFNNATMKLAVRVTATDDVGVDNIKYAQGMQDESYFSSNGINVNNNSVIYLTENGTYTFCTKDLVGNIQISTLTVTNIDTTPPKIDIEVLPDTVGTEATATIDYGDSSVKQYKIGTPNTTWLNYTAPISLSSYTILSNNWQNSDGTVTIYAKGKDSAGNEITVQKQVVNLDLDMPSVPQITSNASYPLLTEYGVTFDDSTIINYDNRNDIDNYYSIDNGTTWQKYTGTFNMTSGTVIAKSVKKSSGLECTKTATIEMPKDAITSEAYDNKSNTNIAGNFNGYMNVDSSMWNKNVYIYASGYTSMYKDFYRNASIKIKFLSSAGKELWNMSVTSTNQKSAYINGSYKIPTDTTRIYYSGYAEYTGTVYLENINIDNAPSFNIKEKVYPLLSVKTDNNSNNVAYQRISINYFETSAQKLYQIDSVDGEWLKYNDQPITLMQGQTLYAKGIDKYGAETNVVSIATNIQDVIDSKGFDNSLSTYISGNCNGYISVSNKLWGKNIYINAGCWTVMYNNFYRNGKVTIEFIGVNNVILKSISATSSNSKDGTIIGNYTVPVNTTKIHYIGDASNNSGACLYDIHALE